MGRDEYTTESASTRSPNTRWPWSVLASVLCTRASPPSPVPNAMLLSSRAAFPREEKGGEERGKEAYSALSLPHAHARNRAPGLTPCATATQVRARLWPQVQPAARARRVTIASEEKEKTCICREGESSFFCTNRASRSNHTAGPHRLSPCETPARRDRSG